MEAGQEGANSRPLGALTAACDSPLAVCEYSQRPRLLPDTGRKRMQPWLIPTIYAAASITAGFLVPRLGAKFVAYSLNLSTSSA
jgi:hypothetical protein